MISSVLMQGHTLSSIQLLKLDVSNTLIHCMEEVRGDFAFYTTGQLHCGCITKPHNTDQHIQLPVNR